MQLEALVERLQLTYEGEKTILKQEVTGVYIGDLLSLVIAHAKAGQIWLTVQGHLNSVAVASLVGIPAIILVEGIQPSEEMKAKSEEEKIALFMSKLDSYTLAKRLAKWL